MCLWKGRKLGLSLYQSTKTFISPNQALSDSSLKVAEMTKFVFDRVENIVGKGENAA